MNIAEHSLSLTQLLQSTDEGWAKAEQLKTSKKISNVWDLRIHAPPTYGFTEKVITITRVLH